MDGRHSGTRRLSGRRVLKHHATHRDLLQLQTEGVELKAEIKDANLALQDVKKQFAKLDKDHKAALAAAA